MIKRCVTGACRYLAEGIEGLKDRPMPGAPSKVTKAYEEQLLFVVRRRPRSLEQPYSMWTLQRLADYMAEQTGIRASYETVRQVLKAGEIVLSRPQHKISSPDPDYLVKKPLNGKLALTVQASIAHFAPPDGKEPYPITRGDKITEQLV